MPQGGWLTSPWPWTLIRPERPTGVETEEVDLPRDVQLRRSLRIEEANAQVTPDPQTTHASTVGNRDILHTTACNAIPEPT